MPQRDLMRTEFFNDFLARDGLHWGVNAYSFVGGRNIGDVRIWRGRRRENFDGHTLELLRPIEPAFTGALVRAAGGASAIAAGGSPILKLSVREFEIARMISDDLSDKEIAHRLQVEVSTVRTHIERIFAKLGVRRRSGVATLFAGGSPAPVRRAGEPPPSSPSYADREHARFPGPVGSAGQFGRCAHQSGGAGTPALQRLEAALQRYPSVSMCSIEEQAARKLRTNCATQRHDDDDVVGRDLQVGSASGKTDLDATARAVREDPDAADLRRHRADGHQLPGGADARRVRAPPAWST
jgi:DNA-binding CsgD family transcriptional regulator